MVQDDMNKRPSQDPLSRAPVLSAVPFGRKWWALQDFKTVEHTEPSCKAYCLSHDLRCYC